MLHARKYFRDKIKEYLDGISIIKQVYVDDPVYLEYEDCPVVFVNMEREDRLISNIGYPRTDKRTLTFNIALYLKTQSNLTDKIDEFAYEIESVFSLSRERVKFENKALTSQITSIDFSFDESQDRDVAKINFTLEIVYSLKEDSLQTL